MSPALQLQLGWKLSSWSLLEPQYDDRGNTSEVIYSSSGEDDDFGDKESTCEEVQKERKHQNTETTARPERRFGALFLVFHSSRSRGEG